MKKSALLIVAAAFALPAAWAETIYANGPSGAHYAKGSVEPTCGAVQGGANDKFSYFSCTGTTIGGVGNTNATATLSVTYSGTVQCRNHGGQIVDVKSQTTVGTPSLPLYPDRNGQIVVPVLTVQVPTAKTLTEAATCPNGNWTKELQGGVVLTSYVYTVIFSGYTQPFISITG
jgi:hypothetical protein